MRKKARSIEGVPLLTWLRRALPEIAASGLCDRHVDLLNDAALSRALKGALRKLRAELLNQDPRDEAQLRAVDTIAAELRLRSRRGRRLVKDRFGGGLGVDPARPTRTQSQATPQEVGSDSLDAVLTAIASVPLRTAWEWFRQGMQLAHTLNSPERGRAATAAGRSLARDTAAALAKSKSQGSSNWILEARVVADLESRLGVLALRDMRESSDPLTPRDIGQAVLEAIASRAEPRLEDSELVRAGNGQRLQVLRPNGDEKCPRCGHDPESCFGAFADEDA